MIGYTGYTYSMNPARIHWCWLNWMAKSTSEPNPWNDINLNSIHIELCVSLSIYISEIQAFVISTRNIEFCRFFISHQVEKSFSLEMFFFHCKGLWLQYDIVVLTLFIDLSTFFEFVLFS